MDLAGKRDMPICYSLHNMLHSASDDHIYAVHNVDVYQQQCHLGSILFIGKALIIAGDSISKESFVCNSISGAPYTESAELH